MIFVVAGLDGFDRRKAQVKGFVFPIYQRLFPGDDLTAVIPVFDQIDRRMILMAVGDQPILAFFSVLCTMCVAKAG